MFNVSVNCYLVRLDDGFVLIDTGRAVQRAVISERLAAEGCTPGTLKLILLTHGDFDHCGNAAYLRRSYGAPIALHADDVGMVERGDMTWNRHIGGVMKALIGLIIRLKPAAQRSLALLKGTPGISTVYPGHGQPFALREL